jgi:hypothetical protein
MIPAQVVLLGLVADGDTEAAEVCALWSDSPLCRVTVQVIRLDPEPAQPANLVARIAEAAGGRPYALLALGSGAAAVLRAAALMRTAYAPVRLFVAGAGLPAAGPGSVPQPTELPGWRVTVLCGAWDPTVPLAVAAAWRTRFAGRCDIQVFDGGTNFLRTCVAEVLRGVQQDMAVPGPGLPGPVPGSDAAEEVPARGEADPPHDWSNPVELVHRLVRIPTYARRFAVSLPEAERRYRIDAELARELIGVGLPHVPGPDGPLFDEHDMINLALCLRRRFPERTVMRYWADGLGRQPGESRTYEVDYLAACPTPGHRGPCEFQCFLPEGRERVCRGDADGGTPLLTVPVHLTNDWPELPEPVVDAVREIADVGFYRLPEAVRWDVGLLVRQRIGDCAAFTRYLVSEGTRRGLRMRAVLGLIVAAPYSTPHYWAEVCVDDRWVPVDPGLIRGMAQWGVLPEGWSPERSPGAFLARLSTRHAYIALHAGMPTAVVFPTRRVSGGTAAD